MHRVWLVNIATPFNNRARSWRLLVALFCALLTLLLSLHLASGRERHLPGAPLPPPNAPDGFRFLFSVAGGADSHLSIPLDVAVGPRGHIYVADGGTHSVQVFGPDGMWQQSIGRPVESAALPGDLVYPLGVTLDDQGNLYVADNATGHISVFDVRGRFLRYFAEDGAGNRGFTVPTGLFYRNSLVYVNDVGSHRVLGFNLDGVLERIFGNGRGSDRGQMLYPNYSWADESGRVYVADSNNNRVQVFSSEGQVERVLESGHAASGNSVVRGIALDSLGNLHLVSSMEHRVLVFDHALQFMYSYGGSGGGPDSLAYPNGLAIAGDRVYVADRANHRVQVWSLGTTPGDGR